MKSNALIKLLTLTIACCVMTTGLLMAIANPKEPAIAQVEKPDRGKPWKLCVIDNSSKGADGVKVVDMNRDGKLDIATGWEEGGVTRLYINPGIKKADQLWPKVTVGKTPSVEDASFIDLDGDGVFELVSCCEGRSKSIFVHWSTTAKGKSKKENYLDNRLWKQELLPASKGKMQWMFSIPMQVDGTKGDNIVAAGKGKAEIGWFEAAKDRRNLKDYKWHAISKAGWIMSLIACDMDNDGDLDVLTTDRRGNLRGCRWLENPGIQKVRNTKQWKNHFIGGKGREVMFATVADLDQDGLQDVLVAVKKQEFIWLRRTNKSGVAWKEFVVSFPNNMGEAKGIAVGDLDQDGKNDVFISCGKAKPQKSGLVWLSYSGDIQANRWKPHEVSGPRGIKFDRIELLDLDGDHDLDILTCEEQDQKKGLGVIWYKNPLKP